MNICIVIENGWIIVGKKVDLQINQAMICLNNASVVRKWTNGKGIGGLAKLENKEEYTLDYIGDVEIYQSKILFVIPCEW